MWPQIGNIQFAQFMWTQIGNIRFALVEPEGKLFPDHSLTA